MADQGNSLAEQVDRIDEKKARVEGYLDQALSDAKRLDRLEERHERRVREAEAEDQGGGEQGAGEATTHAGLVARIETGAPARLVAEGERQQDGRDDDRHRVRGVADVRRELADGQKLHRQDDVAFQRDGDEQNEGRHGEASCGVALYNPRPTSWLRRSRRLYAVRGRWAGHTLVIPGCGEAAGPEPMNTAFPVSWPGLSRPSRPE